MADPSSLSNEHESESTSLEVPAATFEKLQELLKTRDDTSRFVGLALLKSILDNGQLLRDPEKLRILWEALSPRFLDRLLKAEPNEKINKEEAKNMIDLAVSILHTFTILLPETSRNEKRLTGRIAPLLKVLLHSPPETTKLILQTLLTLTSQSEGSLELLSIPDVSPLVELASQYPLVLDILLFTWTNSAANSTESQNVRESITKIMPSLVLLFRDTDAVTFIRFVGDLLPKLELQAIPQNPKWLKPLILMLRKLVVSKPTITGRVAYTQTAAALLQSYPTTCPKLLFRDEPSGQSESKPFPYLFINLLLIDLRSSFPSLLSKLNSDEYPGTSSKLGAAFDIVSNFIGFLIRSLDDDADSSGLTMAPDLLLKLRKDIAETLSLTIEYLRDRWDASVAGASGLHPSARSGTAATSEGTRLTLTWDSIKDNVSADPLILAGIRTLAIWIREDDNENLRNESAGLMDMWIELYKLSSDGLLDFRYPILLALEGTMVSEEGLDSFLDHDGWHILHDDLYGIYSQITEAPRNILASDSNRGMQIIRVLLAVVDHPSTSYPQESWMSVVTGTAGLKLPNGNLLASVLEFYIAMVQLSLALLAKSADGMTKRYITSQAPLAGLMNQLRRRVERLDDDVEATELKGLLDDAALELENMRAT